MKLQTKLVILIGAVAVVPLSISALAGMRVHQSAVEDAISELHQRTAQSAAAEVEGSVDQATSTLKLMVTNTLQWEGLSEEERASAVWLTYRQFDNIAFVLLLDETKRVRHRAYLESVADQPDLLNHPTISTAALKAQLQNLPTESLSAGETRIGSAFRSGASVTLPLGIGVTGPDGLPWLIIAGLDTAFWCRSVLSAAPERLDLAVADLAGTILCSGDSTKVGTTLPDAQRTHTIGEITGADGIATWTVRQLSEGGFAAITEQPASVAFATSRRLRFQALFWLAVSAALAGFVGVFLSRSITKPVEALAAGAEELANGNFDHPISVRSDDELGTLSATFNEMATQIRARDLEIREWNEDLQNRVEVATRDLKQAQGQLVQTQKMAAVNALGAGMAHEINNPLAGVLGLTQLVIKNLTMTGDHKTAGLLQKVEVQARRIKEIVASLLKMSQGYGSVEGFKRRDLDTIVDASVNLISTRFEEAKIAVARDRPKDVPEVLCDGNQLEQAFHHILVNAILAMPDGGELDVVTKVIDRQAVGISFTDTGSGISEENIDRIFEPFFTTKGNWRGVGLGLTEAYRIVEQHHGSIAATSEVGVGTTITVILPASKSGAHLE